jgi:hypothetical protein
MKFPITQSAATIKIPKTTSSILISFLCVRYNVSKAYESARVCNTSVKDTCVYLKNK